MAVRPAKTQSSLGTRPVWSESSLSAWRKLGSLATHWAHSEDSDQTGLMPRLIWVFAGCRLILLVFSCRGSLVYWSDCRQFSFDIELHGKQGGVIFCHGLGLLTDLVRVNENLYDHGAQSDRLTRFAVPVDKVLKSLQEPDKVFLTVKVVL